MIHQEDTKGWSQGKGNIDGEIEVAYALSSMPFRADIGDQHDSGGVEESYANSLENPNNKKRPKSVGQ